MKNYGEDMRSSMREAWKKAMHEEVTAFEDNGVWKMIKGPANCNVLQTKWFYKTKTDAQGDIERIKARLVACGDEQGLGVDYSLTFAPSWTCRQ